MNGFRRGGIVKVPFSFGNLVKGGWWDLVQRRSVEHGWFGGRLSVLVLVGERGASEPGVAGTGSAEEGYDLLELGDCHVSDDLAVHGDGDFIRAIVVNLMAGLGLGLREESDELLDAL